MTGVVNRENSWLSPCWSLSVLHIIMFTWFDGHDYIVSTHCELYCWIRWSVIVYVGVNYLRSYFKLWLNTVDLDIFFSIKVYLNWLFFDWWSSSWWCFKEFFGMFGNFFIRINFARVYIAFLTSLSVAIRVRLVTRINYFDFGIRLSSDKFLAWIVICTLIDT